MKRNRARMTVLALALAVGAALHGGLGVEPAPGAGVVATVGEWRFDEPGGQHAFDRGRYGLDGRLGTEDAGDAAEPVRISGASGGALRFDGSSFVRLPDAPELAPASLTAEAVVRAPASPGRWRYVVSRGSHRCHAGAYGLYTGAAGGMAIYVFDGSRYVVSATARPEDIWDGEWHHVAGTLEGHVLRLFVDGRPVGEPGAFSGRIDYESTSTATYLGQYAGGCDLALRADLDMVRLWSGALSADGVAAAARAESQSGGAPGPWGPAPPLTAAAPPTTIAASGTGTGANGSTQPGAPPRACMLRLSRRHVTANRATVVRVRVKRRGVAVRAMRVIATWAGRAGVLTAARTGARGRVRLVIDVRRRGHVRISAARKSLGCASVELRVRRAGEA